MPTHMYHILHRTSIGAPQGAHLRVLVTSDASGIATGILKLVLGRWQKHRASMARLEEDPVYIRVVDYHMCMIVEF